MIIADHEQEAGRQAAARASAVLRRALERQPQARVIFASAPSQQAMLTHLAEDPRIDWTRVRSFHMDEYLGLPADHPAAFGTWLRLRLPEAAHEGFSTIHTDGHLTQEAERYAALLREAPIDLVCLGIGVNGHIAFNEPGQARRDDPELVRVIELDETSRRQQVEEGLFPSLDDVPTHALTLTVPALLRGRSLVCTVIGAHKADAVTAALEGPIDPQLPGSLLREHRDVQWFLDREAASRLASPLPSGR